MTILDLIKKCALMLNISQITEDESLNDISYNNEFEIMEQNVELKRMFEIAKMVIDEINVYSPSILKYVGTTNLKRIVTNDFYNFAKIISVKDENDCYVKFTATPKYIYVEQDGTYTITYQSYPEINSLMREIDRQGGKISEETFVSGVNSYYSLINGQLPEFKIYNSLYLEHISRFKNLKLFAMPCRSWHG